MGLSEARMKLSIQELRAMLASTDISFSDMRDECIGRQLDVAAVADICGITTSMSESDMIAELVQASRAVRAAAYGKERASSPTLFEQVDFTDTFYARDAPLLCFLLLELFSPADSVSPDRLCRLVSIVVCGEQPLLRN